MSLTSVSLCLAQKKLLEIFQNKVAVPLAFSAQHVPWRMSARHHWMANDGSSGERKNATVAAAVTVAQGATAPQLLNFDRVSVIKQTDERGR